MVRPVLALLLLLDAGGLAAQLDVRARGEKVSVHARAVPLWQVLDRLSQQTGMKVIYEGPRPAALITTTSETSSETELLTGLMEGLGLNYAFQTDPTGRRVQRLLVGEAVPAPGVVASSRDQRPASLRPAPQPPAWSEVPEDDESDFGTGGDNLPPAVTVPSLPSPSLPSSQLPNGARYPGLDGIAIPGVPGAASHPIPPVRPPTFPQGASGPAHQ
jgi:hypothetical protein